MGFMTRLATLLKADAHGVVDALEDRALMLRQHVREAGAELARKRVALETLDVEEKGLEAEARTLGEQKQKLDDDVTLALREEQDNLARFAVANLLPLSRRIHSIGRRREVLAEERSELAADLGRQEAEFEQLEAQARAYLARLGHGDDPRVSADIPWWEPVAEEEIELELLRRRQAVVKGET